MNKHDDKARKQLAYNQAKAKRLKEQAIDDKYHNNLFIRIIINQYFGVMP